MKIHIHTLQKALTYYYFLVLFLTFTILVSSFCGYYLTNLRASEYLNMQNLSKSVASSLKQEVDSMSAVSMNMIYSNAIDSGISYLAEPDHSPQERYNKTQELFRTMFDFFGLQQHISQVNIYPENGKALGTGFYTFQKDMSVSDRPWYPAAAEKNGNRYMTVPAPLPYYMSSSPFAMDKESYIALVRLYYDHAHQPKGAVEVLESSSDFFAQLQDTLLSNEHIRIFILNEEGQLVYPLDDTDMPDAVSFHQQFAQGTLPSDTIHTLKDTHSQKHAVLQTTLSSIGWSIYLSEPDSVIFHSLAKSILFFLCVLVVISILTFRICFMISNRILLPLRQLQGTFETIHLDDLLSSKNSLALPDSHYVEIRTLIDAFNTMYEKLNHSTTQMIQAKAEEIKAKEIATQSLMKPHFLYNNLATIGIMAEEHMNEEIMTLTENLSDYLRYTSTASSKYVSVRDEFLYTEKYLLCMEVRYKDRLSYSFSLNPEEEAIIVPKLIVQPLVENALKYAFYKSAPWRISVSCSQSENHWYISVQDNGIGFSDESRLAVLETLEKVRQTRDVSQLKIGGMGLANVYLRLLLMYGDDAIFQIQNNKTTGACITIGGNLNYGGEGTEL